MAAPRKIESLLRLMGMPRSKGELLSLSPEAETRVLAALVPSLRQGSLDQHRRKRLLQRVAYGRIAYRRLRRNSIEDRAIIGLLTWTARQEETLARVGKTARALLKAIVACETDRVIQVRFSYSKVPGFNYRTARKRIGKLCAALDQVVERHPDVTASRRPDYAFNALIAALAFAWSDATGRPVSRSRNKHTGPVEFISAVLETIGHNASDDKIVNAIQWLERLRKTANSDKIKVRAVKT